LTKKQSKPNSIGSIPYVHLSSFIAPAVEGKSAETFKCTLLTEPAALTAYVKLTRDPRQLIADLASAQVGRAIGLKIPQPFLVFVDTDLIPDNISCSYKNTGAMLAFGSAEAVEGMSFARLLKTDNKTAENLFKSWGDGFSSTSIFDEWIANPDRNFGNILFCPATNENWLIDHDQALTGVYWPLWGLDNPTISVTNTLLDAAQTNMDDDDKLTLRKKTQQLMLKCSAIDFNEFDRDKHFCKIDKTIDDIEIREFLEKRIYATVSLICNRIGLTELDLS